MRRPITTRNMAYCAAIAASFAAGATPKTKTPHSFASPDSAVATTPTPVVSISAAQQ
ncbi:MAG: hypothetical protein V9G24_08115 [Rhodoblastus sp.]